MYNALRILEAAAPAAIAKLIPMHPAFSTIATLRHIYVRARTIILRVPPFQNRSNFTPIIQLLNHPDIFFRYGKIIVLND